MAEGDLDVAAWRERLREHRRAKDAFFASGAESPLPPDARADFDGLAYYDLDPDYRVTARVQWAHRPEAVELEMTRGPPAEYERAATLGFVLDGDHRTLAAFRVESVDGLFVPFADRTNGDATYEGGRYVELDVDRETVATGEAVALDFNLAYQPFCAYDDGYVCPLPPDENRLDARVEAGEKSLPT